MDRRPRIIDLAARAGRSEAIGKDAVSGPDHTAPGEVSRNTTWALLPRVVHRPVTIIPEERAPERDT